MKFGEDAYKARGERKYRPNAGIKGLSSEYLSSGQQAFVRKVTVNWTCFTLEDLNILQERFMTLGRKVYVEWGWASTKMNKKPVFLRNYDSEQGSYSVNDELVNDNEIKDEKGNVTEIESAAQKLKEEVLNSSGSFDAIVGYVDGFEFSQRDDGGFDCTTNLTVNGGNIFKTKTETKSEPGELDESGKIIVKDEFLDTMKKLPRILDQYIDTSLNQPAQSETIYEDYTTAGSFETQVIPAGALDLSLIHI